MGGNSQCLPFDAKISPSEQFIRREFNTEKTLLAAKKKISLLISEVPCLTEEKLWSMYISTQRCENLCFQD